MYEPGSPPRDEMSSGQWASYDSGSHIPPRDPPSPPSGMNVPPPPGRQYVYPIDPPSWNPGVGDTDPALGVDAAMSYLKREMIRAAMEIAGGALLGYALTGKPRGAAGGALAVVGLAQLPLVFEVGGPTRALLGLGALGASYWCLHPFSVVLRGKPGGSGYDRNEWFAANEDEDDVGDDEDEGDEGGEGYDDGPEPAQSNAPSTAKHCSFDTGEPATKSPWLRQVRRAK